ncbi:olfactory receptor 10A7-like [Candoia aspera]|uniref:olfactory receptor 10A7-like n=1 Tax=Candoia aspera TaxID=51853 RepID=UPI002FD7E185
MENGNITFLTFVLLGFSNHPCLEIALFLVVSIIYGVTLFGNFSIIILIGLDSRLHTPMYFSLSNLAVLNIYYTSVVVPKMLINFLVVRKTISYTLCMVQVYTTLFLGAAECLLLLVMAIDRYIAICNPLHYVTTMDKTVCLSLAFGAWIISFLLVIPSFIMTPSLCSSTIDHLFCEVPVMLQLACPNADTSVSEILMITGSMLTLLMPLILILLSYIRIIITIRRISSADGKRKAFSTCSAHIMVVTIYYGSGMFMYLRPKASYSAEKDKLISLFYSVINPMLNPIIYSLRNNDVKEAILKVLERTKASYQE